MGGYAWVTLATNDAYSLGALVLAHSLRRVGTKHELAVLVTPGVTEMMREKLAAVFTLVQEVNVLDSKDEANLALLARPELGITFTKLHCWRLTQYDKCVFVDADTLVLRNCDELFEREELSAAPDVGWPDCFNSGVFVFKPSQQTFASITAFAAAKGSFDGGDQGLLNMYFSDWARTDISKHLPFIYNMCSTATYSYLPAFKQFGEDVRIIHFIGITKPWLQYFDTETGIVQPPAGAVHLQPLLQLWWNIFCEKVHPQLSPVMATSTLAPIWHKFTSFEPPPPPPPPRISVHHDVHSDTYSDIHTYPPDFSEFKDPWEDYSVKSSSFSNQWSQTERNECSCSTTNDVRSVQAWSQDYPVHEDTPDENYYNQHSEKQHSPVIHAEQFYYQPRYDEPVDRNEQEAQKCLGTNDSYSQTYETHQPGVYSQQNERIAHQEYEEHHHHHQSQHHNGTQHYQGYQHHQEHQHHHENTHEERHEDYHQISDHNNAYNDQHQTDSHPTNNYSPHRERQEHNSHYIVSESNKETDHHRKHREDVKYDNNENYCQNNREHLAIHTVHHSPVKDSDIAFRPQYRHERSGDRYSDVNRSVHVQTDISRISESPPPPKPCTDLHNVAPQSHLNITGHLDSSNAGLAGALAQITLGAARSAEQLALEEHMRKQSWEQGQIDYMGRDSFDNIWKKICETLSLAPQRQPTPPKEVKEPEEAAEQPPVTESIDPPSAPETETTTARGGNEPAKEEPTPAVRLIETDEKESPATDGPPASVEDASELSAKIESRQSRSETALEPATADPALSPAPATVPAALSPASATVPAAPAGIPPPELSTDPSLSPAATPVSSFAATTEPTEPTESAKPAELAPETLLRQQSSTEAPLSDFQRAPSQRSASIDVPEEARPEESSVAPSPVCMDSPRTPAFEEAGKESEDPMQRCMTTVADEGVLDVARTDVEAEEANLVAITSGELDRGLAAERETQSFSGGSEQLARSSSASSESALISPVPIQVAESVLQAEPKESVSEDAKLMRESVISSIDIPVLDTAAALSGMVIEPPTVPPPVCTNGATGANDISHAAVPETALPAAAEAVEAADAAINLLTEPRTAGATETRAPDSMEGTGSILESPAEVEREAKVDSRTSERVSPPEDAPIEPTKSAEPKESEEIEEPALETIEGDVSRASVESSGSFTQPDTAPTVVPSEATPLAPLETTVPDAPEPAVESSSVPPSEDSPVRPTRTKELNIPATPTVTEATPPTSPPVMAAQEPEGQAKVARKTVKKVAKKPSDGELAEVGEGEGGERRSVKKVVKKVAKKPKEGQEEGAAEGAGAAEKPKKTTKVAKKTSKPAQTLSADEPVPETPPPPGSSTTPVPVPVPPKRKTKATAPSAKPAPAKKPDAEP